MDLDGLWTIAAAYGYAEVNSFERDPIFEKALPRLLDWLDQFQIRATFFVVGRDLELDHKREAIREILRRGHDLGNHSQHHRIGMEQLTDAELRDEIARCQNTLGELAGVAPLGFRAPGYDAGPRVLATCAELGLQYDGSILPTFWNAALRFSAGRLRHRTTASRDDFSGQYGSASFAAMDLAPQQFWTDRSARPLLRLPLAVSPNLRLPLHMSLGMVIGLRATQRGLTRLAARGWPMTFLLHGLDAAEPEEYRDQLPKPLAASRVMNPTLQQRKQFFDGVIATLKATTRIQTTREYLAVRND